MMDENYPFFVNAQQIRLVKDKQKVMEVSSPAIIWSYMMGGSGLLLVLSHAHSCHLLSLASFFFLG
jgi:hypothetical protein